MLMPAQYMVKALLICSADVIHNETTQSDVLTREQVVLYNIMNFVRAEK
jgi:hypothetical protein